MDIEIVLDSNLTPGQVAEIAVVAEKGGIRTLWHGNFAGTWDPFVTLVTAAEATSKIMLGALAVSPYEMHPLKIVSSLLSLNEIANGRAIVGIGGGGAVLVTTQNPGAHIDYRKLRVVRGVREAIEIVKAASSGGLMKAYEGELFKVTRPLDMSWVKAAPAKVFACSQGPQMTRMGARFADGMQFGDVTMHRVPEIMDNIEAGMAKRKQPVEDFRIGNYWAWHIKPDREKSMFEARRSLVWRAELVPPFHGLSDILNEEDAQLVKDNFHNFAKAYYTGSDKIEGVPDALVDYLVAAVTSSGDYGDIDHEVERLNELKTAGFTDLALKIFDDPMNSVKLICKRVVPKFT